MYSKIVNRDFLETAPDSFSTSLFFTDFPQTLAQNASVRELTGFYPHFTDDVPDYDPLTHHPKAWYEHSNGTNYTHWELTEIET